MIERCFVICLLTWLHYCQGMSVSVFTEAGKETLSGLHCRTTVKLFCNATNLLHFRWTYNASKIEIVNFQPDGILTLNQMTTTYSAFPFVQLTQFNAYKNQQNQSRINASTILTVDLSELYKQNIEIISCGSTSPKDTATLPVNISILLPFFPSVTPDVYVSVTIRYESGVLSSVDVSWRKFRQPDCPEYDNSQEYLINVTGCGWMWINHSTCEDNICSSLFSNCTDNVREINLQAKIFNIESEQVLYPTSVDYDNLYFKPVVNWSSICQNHVQCLPIQGDNSEHRMCTIRYTLNPEYRNLSNPIKTLVGAAPVLLSHITPSNMYYFEFSVLMNETLLIVERMEYMITETGGTPTELFQLNAGKNIIIATIMLFFGCFTVHTTAILCLLKYRDAKISRLNMFITKKHVQISITLILLMLFILCATLLTTFAIISNESDVCFTNQQVPNSLLDAMLVISCLGIAFILTYWVSVGYKVYKQSTKEIKTKPENRTTSHCNGNLHQNGKSHVQIAKSLCNLQEPVEEHYNTLEHALSSRPSNRYDTQDEIYGKIEETFEYLPTDVGVYEPLRATEKSKPVPNLADANYSHLGETQPESAISDIICSIRIRDDYDVLDRNETSLCTSVDIHDPCKLVYGNLEEASIEPNGDVYNQLRPEEKSRPVPNMTDSNYSHIDEEQSLQRQLKIRHFKKTKSGK
ncbi:uncharacterized protein LOC135351174 [Halichondria panicea]|uniref:uncharacterized protein LOC135351174 n=1 Tax=Halichondria panicea TaxID=6063 RepID=UPI00312BAEBB